MKYDDCHSSVNVLCECVVEIFSHQYIWANLLAANTKEFEFQEHPIQGWPHPTTKIKKSLWTK